VLDCGICGRDWIVETGADVVEVCELQYSKVRKPVHVIM
jgi:ATP phosphoribosyltransferase